MTPVSQNAQLLHYRSKQISVATPLWSATTPNQQFTSAFTQISSEVVGNEYLVSFNVNPPHGLPWDAGLKLCQGINNTIYSHSTLHATCFDSLAKLSAALNVHHISYIAMDAYISSWMNLSNYTTQTH